MTGIPTDLTKYRGQWGGKIENGEEMWWSEPNARVFKGGLRGRLRFLLDTRQYFLFIYLKKAIANRSRPVVLDFGSGTGGLTLSFSKLLGVPILGFDIFETQVKIANEQARRLKNPSTFALLATTDGEDGRFPLADASADAILSADVLGHVPDIARVLAEWARVLRPGGCVSLFTEATYSEGDHSLQARLARKGLDLCEAVPEHISLFPRERLESLFCAAGFEIVDRRSANLLHWFFFPKDYVLLFERARRSGPLAWASRAWNHVSKLIPFYPVPHETLRLLLTLAFGRNAYGTGYFYFLKKHPDR